MFDTLFEESGLQISNIINKLEENLGTVYPVEYRGKIVSACGATVTADLPNSNVGDLCLIVNGDSNSILAEIVAIQDGCVRLIPFGSILGISMNSYVIKKSDKFLISVGDFLIGKVVNGFGDIYANLVEYQSNLNLEMSSMSYPILNNAPDPLTRTIISETVLTGVKAIDLFITCGKGQRLAIFAGPGMGKTTLLSMIIKNNNADIIVVALIGERGREVKEFIDIDIDEDSRKKCVIVVATSDRPHIEQVKAAYTAQTIAEYFRDCGKDVILFVDSITRFARAQRELGLSSGEEIVRGGFPSSVFTAFPKLMERAGNNHCGSITAFYTVLMDGEHTQDDPIADEVRSIVDGHIILSRNLAERGHFPAIDVTKSLSRVADRIVDDEHKKNAQRVRLLLSKFEEIEFLIKVGEYKAGNDPLTDEAIKKNELITNTLLKQGVNEKVYFDHLLSSLSDIA